MTTRMLIDARHREETRVAVVTGNKIEEFDFESAEHKQLKGNIYLAKVTRVEPSLQAAFVDYGGNRHGFLAFAEIHPDYYQIPKEDRERLLADEAAAAAEEAALLEQEDEAGDDGGDARYGDGSDDGADHDHDHDHGAVIEIDDDDHVDTIDAAEGETPVSHEEDGDEDEAAPRDDDEKAQNRRHGRRGRGRPGKAKASDEARAKRMNIRRRYKIQDVIHRRQVLLVQVAKEERGNKGAALTTYLSLAGRYCVLMPNTSHGGGISRKINSAADRKRLKSIIADMTLPATMGCIIRTAGLARTKPEIKRDFDYLARLWDEIREKTLKASAPALIHTDSDLIKRAIRDIYNRDIGEVIVEGEDGYRAAKDFMKLLMPSHARRVQQYADPVPLFQRYGAEDQLNAMYHPIVQLKSGGYIVINPTEALVSIDINSGRSTKEHGIEQTALSTNLEAAREIARQLRLRDMAGLVVIDFIDMEHHSNNRKVERAMKDALKNDRARIQVGRISSFGLMEMSRQRLRTGVLEASTRPCPHCEGTGLVRTESSSALSALRLIEDEAARGNGSFIQLQASQEATIYVLNQKRAELADIEDRYHVQVAIIPNGEVEGAKMAVSCSGPKPDRPHIPPPMIDMQDSDEIDEIEGVDDENFDDEFAEETGGETGADEASDPAARDNGDAADGKRKRRRGRRGGRNRDRKNRDDAPSANVDIANDGSENSDENNAQQAADKSAAITDGKPPRARRGRRGDRARPSGAEQADIGGAPLALADGAADAAAPEDSASDDTAIAAEKPKGRRRSAGKSAPAVAAMMAEPGAGTQDGVQDGAQAIQTAKPKRASRAKPKASTETLPDAAAKPAKPRPPRKGKPPAEKSAAPVANAAETAAAIEAAPAVQAPKKRAARGEKGAPPPALENAMTAPDAAKDGADESTAEAPRPARSGWWQRTFG